MAITTQEVAWLGRVEDLFLRFGIKSITMDDVASDLGISKKTLYQMVDSKDDLVIKVLDHHISREKSRCIDMASRARNALEEIFILLDSNSQELAQMKANVVNDLQKYHKEAWAMIRDFQYDYVFKIIRENLIRGRKEGLYREDFDLDIIARLHLASAFSIFDPHLFPEGNNSKITLFKEHIMHYLHGIVTPQGLIYLKKKFS